MSTALAIVPTPAVIEFRRCTGHCCDPVTLPEDPGYFRRWVAQGNSGDVAWVNKHLIYLGWRPPSQGGWPEFGTHEYRCPYFDQNERKCLIYGTGKRARICREHPEYSQGPWKVCNHDGCTRRTMVMDPEQPLRWRFPNLRDEDRKRWYLFESRPCEATAAPECQDERYER
jgi:Fe-S-cluster containining protein